MQIPSKKGQGMQTEGTWTYHMNKITKGIHKCVEVLIMLGMMKGSGFEVTYKQRFMVLTWKS